MKLIRGIAIVLTLAMLAVGLGICLYPMVRGYAVDHSIQREAQAFLDKIDGSASMPSFSVPEVVVEDTVPDAPDTYTELWRDMTAYNERICAEGQQSLNCQMAYEDTQFCLADHGLESEAFAVISIPKLDIEMPVFLGATYEHMADGAALLGQTSIPIGGRSTNSVIAGHRGWKGASYFRYIDKLVSGDEVIITNLWETLHYTVTGTKIIEPDEVDEILIQKDKDLITLLTCHPYASGGRQRYLVVCERVSQS